MAPQQADEICAAAASTATSASMTTDRSHDLSILHIEPLIDDLLCLGNNRFLAAFLKRCWTLMQRR
jgi:hypothetical protein